MCGIAGIIAFNPQRLSQQRLQQMTGAIAHRGPDGTGYWLQPQGHVGFGHCRLAIIDLSPRASQPMHYLNRYTIIYNGEIYNYPELRESLQQKGYTFHTQSDTEVILAAFDCYKNDCVQHFDGMFAFAIWDEQEQLLFMARDRFGEKPLYYYHDEEQFIFGSEMKALWAAGIDRKMDEQMLFNYFTLGYVQDPHNLQATFYTSIYKLPARSFITCRFPQNEVSCHTYWDVDAQYINHTIKEHEAIDQFTSLLMTSVQRRLRSDVPVGMSLSGGTDSSSVLACINQLTVAAGVTTFSATFPGFERDESVYIQQLSDRFAVPNYQVTPTADIFTSDFEKICHHQEEPFQSSSVLTQYKVYELAGHHGVKVLLDGQGADEILAGYYKYFPWYWQELYRHHRSLLQPEIKAARHLGITAPWNWKNKLAATFPQYAAAHMIKRRSRQQRRQTALTSDFIASYGQSHYDLPYLTTLNGVLYYNTFLNGLEELLRYADRNSMAHGAEVRLPFLNHTLVAFVFSLPATFKIKEGRTKWLLRKSMEKQLPQNISWRKDKVGFEPPQQLWMQNARVQDYIHEARKRLVQHGILNNTVLQKKIQPHEAHAADNYDWRYLVAGTLL
jgi:asparagine synthase (glutamine-hydrolysing)